MDEETQMRHLCHDSDKCLGECKCADGSPALDGEILQGEIRWILNDSKGGKRDFYLEKLQMQK